ncbi:hypothetical protein D3C71_1677140 [compost metagenome]
MRTGPKTTRRRRAKAHINCLSHFPVHIPLHALLDSGPAVGPHRLVPGHGLLLADQTEAQGDPARPECLGRHALARVFPDRPARDARAARAAGRAGRDRRQPRTAQRFPDARRSAALAALLQAWPRLPDRHGGSERTGCRCAPGRCRWWHPDHRGQGRARWTHRR